MLGVIRSCARWQEVVQGQGLGEWMFVRHFPCPSRLSANPVLAGVWLRVELASGVDSLHSNPTSAPYQPAELR